MKPAASSFRRRQRTRAQTRRMGFLQPDYVVSCGNVFADLGLPNPEMLLAAAKKAHSKEEFTRLCKDIPRTPSVRRGTTEKRKQEPKPGSTYHAPDCDCCFCKMGTTRF